MSGYFIPKHWVEWYLRMTGRMNMNEHPKLCHLAKHNIAFQFVHGIPHPQIHLQSMTGSRKVPEVRENGDQETSHVVYQLQST